MKKDYGRRNSGDREFVFTVSLGHECTERTRRYLGGQLAAWAALSAPISCHVMFHLEFLSSRCSLHNILRISRSMDDPSPSPWWAGTTRVSILLLVDTV